MKAITFVAIVLIVFAVPYSAVAQQDSLVDVFPLAVGNQWVYRYFTQTVFNGGPGLLTTTDSGRAQYQIVGSNIGTNTISWSFLRTRDIMHWISVPDTTYPIHDTMVFIIAEDLSGQHQLYRHNYDELDVFPFTIAFTDTTRVYRYRRVGAGDTVRFQSGPPLPPPLPTHNSIFTFKKGVGLLQYEFVGGPVDLSMESRHLILSWVITNVPDKRFADEPGEFVLYQNYPNPFNPTTNIGFQISDLSHSRYLIFLVAKSRRW